MTHINLKLRLYYIAIHPFFYTPWSVVKEGGGYSPIPSFNLQLLFTPQTNLSLKASSKNTLNLQSEAYLHHIIGQVKFFYMLYLQGPLYTGTVKWSNNTY